MTIDNQSPRKRRKPDPLKVTWNGSTSFRTISNLLTERKIDAPAAKKDLKAGTLAKMSMPSLSNLCRQYKGSSLEDIYEMKIETTQDGSCLHLIDEVSPFALDLPPTSLVTEAINAELRLIYNVGDVVAEILRSQGIRQISDLTNHVRFGASAKWVADCLNQRKLVELHDHMRYSLGGAGHCLGLLLSSLLPSEKFVILDVETLGLYGSTIFLFGFACFSQGELKIDQYLARSGEEELVALSLALDQLKKFEALVTYNGRSADLSWIRQRCAYWGLQGVPKQLHFDLLYPTRHRSQNIGFGETGDIPNFSLSTVEEFILGLERDMEDVSGAAVPTYYIEYQRRKNIGPLVPVIDHNRADLVSVAKLLNLMVHDVQKCW